MIHRRERELDSNIKRTGPSKEEKVLVGQRLRERRLAKKIKITKLLDDLDLKRGTYTGYEGGFRMPDGGLLRTFAEYLGTTTDYLTGRTDDPYPIKTGDAVSLAEVIKNGKAFFGDYNITEEDWLEFHELFVKPNK